MMYGHRWGHPGCHPFFGETPGSIPDHGQPCRMGPMGPMGGGPGWRSRRRRFNAHLTAMAFERRIPIDLTEVRADRISYFEHHVLLFAARTVCRSIMMHANIGHMLGLGRPIWPEHMYRDVPAHSCREHETIPPMLSMWNRQAA